MPPGSIASSFMPLRALPDLVGREAELRQIIAAAQDSKHSYIIYITGRGGLGKTRLEKDALEKLRSLGLPIAVVTDLIDLYDTQEHSIAGIVESLLILIEPLRNFFETECRRSGKPDLLQQVAREEQEGGVALAEYISQQAELTHLFLNAMNDFTARHRLAIAFDTTERLSDTDSMHQGEKEDAPSMLEWLLQEFIPNVKNVVILLAGRPFPPLETALRRLQETHTRHILWIDLPGLSEKDVRAYFQQVVQKCRSSAANDTDRRVAGTIEALLEQNWCEQVFYCLCEEDQTGRLSIPPIQLALVIDYLAVEGRPLRTFSLPIEEARQLSAEQRENNRELLAKELVRIIKEHRQDTDLIIDSLGWLTKGCDASLMRRIVADTGYLNANEVQNGLKNIRDLSFIKFRRDRYFLHDEMYELLRRYVQPSIAPPRRAQIYRAIAQYYHQKIEEARQQIAQLYEPLEETALPHPRLLINAYTDLRDALVENLHYSLWDNVEQGLHTFVRYIEEALEAGDPLLYSQLCVELQNFLHEYGRAKLGELEQVFIAELEIATIKRLYFTQKIEMALEKTDNLLEGGLDGNRLRIADLQCWKGLLQAMVRSDWQAAETTLDAVIMQLEKLVAENLTEDQEKRRQIVLARAYNNRGYVARLQNQLVQASDAYRSALRLWRDLYMEFHQATTLNNLAYALGLQGFDAATRTAQDALELREKLGPRRPIVLSLTASAEIAIQFGQYDDALRYASRARSLAEAIHFRRGEGLALLVLASHHRFLSEKVSRAERRRLLDEGLRYAEEGHLIFSKEIREAENEIHALELMGTMHREKCRIAPDDKDCDANFDRAEQKFLEAIRRSQENGLWRLYLDAALGRAWTHYYTDRPDMEKLLMEVEDQLRRRFPNYIITPQQMPNPDLPAILVVCGQRARMHILYARMALDVKNLAQAAEQFTLAFEYAKLQTLHTTGRFRESIRASDLTYLCLKGLNPDEFKIIVAAVGGTLGKLLPADTKKEELSFWQFLKEHFGISG